MKRILIILWPRVVSSNSDKIASQLAFREYMCSVVSIEFIGVPT